jgi:deoxyadenosine/deoxycytidine kinase
MAKKLILVAGNIGSGKTSLTERIGERLGWRTAYESVADNPYLPHFYKDMKSWSFHLQVYFLGHRAKQHLEMANDPRSSIIDRSIYEDAFIFARALNHMSNLSEMDYHTYLDVFDLLVRTLPVPSMLIYLKCPVPVLLKRINKRGREIESGISADSFPCWNPIMTIGCAVLTHVLYSPSVPTIWILFINASIWIL